MKKIVLLLFPLCLASCTYQEPLSKSLNGWTVPASTEREVRQGVIAEQTLFPYHFVNDCPELTELGMRDVRVLAEHYRDCSGTLRIRQGGVSPQLYQARRAHVADVLCNLGVPRDRVKMTDLPAAGEGLTSTEAIKILREKPSEYTEDIGTPVFITPPPGDDK
jgi:hypothetical protein